MKCQSHARGKGLTGSQQPALRSGYWDAHLTSLSDCPSFFDRRGWVQKEQTFWGAMQGQGRGDGFGNEGVLQPRAHYQFH